MAVSKIAALTMALMVAGVSSALAGDPLAGTWDSHLGDRFEFRDGKIKTRGAFGRYEGTKGRVISSAANDAGQPMQCDLELVGASTLKGVCYGGRFINPYEFTAQKM